MPAVVPAQNQADQELQHRGDDEPEPEHECGETLLIFFDGEELSRCRQGERQDHDRERALQQPSVPTGRPHGDTS
jgi:hypothetical protein